MSDTTICHVCGDLGGATREGYDFPICPRHAIPTAEEMDARTNEGAEPWHHREPRPNRDLHHDQVIVLNDTALFQQSTPVHVNGAAYRPSTHRTVPREVSEREAATLAAERLDALPPAQSAVVRLRLAGMACAAIAERLGIRVGTVYERLRRSKVRGA